MRGGREEDGKVVSPMFPRLHVNDADKGGPRAPPRNKMALYEQLSIPSLRFKHAAGPTIPVSSGNSAAAVPSASSSQGYGHEKNMHPSYYSSPQTPSHSIEKAHLSSDGKNSSSSRLVPNRRSAKHVSCGSVNAPAHLRSAARDLTSSTNSSRKECEDEDDFRVPTFVQSDKDQHVSEGPSVQAESPQRCALGNYNSAIGLPKANGNAPEHAVITNSKSKKHERSDSEQMPKESVSPKVQKQKPTSHVGSGEKNSHALNIQKASCNQGNAKVVLNNHKTLHNGGKKLHQGSSCTGNWGASRCSTETEVAEKGLTAASVKSASKTSNTNYPRNLNQAENYSENDDKISGSLDNGDMEKHDDGSDTSMVDSDSGFDISPDDVVSVIGPKHFWKARRAIVNQQRVFAVQVFELHRLIKVQKLIAASPDLLLEGNPCLHKSSTARTKIDSSEQNMKSQRQSAKWNDDQHKTNNSVYSSENTPRVLPLPSQEDSLNRSHVTQVPQSEPYPGNTTPVSKASENRPNPQCFHPQGNQWLVPVMSPLEGLVYKPYMGPCPPPVGFMAPVFGGYGPMAMPPVVGNFVNATYGVPVSHQQQNFGIIPGNPAVVPHYFPAPYGHAVANPTTPGSDAEQTKFPTGIQSNGNVEQQSRNLCDTLDPRSEAISGSAEKIQASKDCELHGSSESSPNDRVLPFFPEVSVAEGSDQPVQNHHSDRQTQVIKVVPHNAMTATESAARIFRCIQNERLQYD